MNAAQPKPIITIGKFQNVDLRVARVIEISDVVEIPDARSDKKKRCCVLKLDVGVLGSKTSVGQFALVPKEELLDRKVVVCCNFAPRPMGPYSSEVLTLGSPHPESPPDEAQAIPLYAHDLAEIGSTIF
jgi:tRNA-binding protein